MNIKFLFVAFLVFLSFSKSINAQYTYADFNVGYRWVTFQNNDLYEGVNAVRNSQVTANFSLLIRPIRRIGIGLDLAVPVSNSFKWNFSESPTTSSNTFYDEENEFSTQANFAPTNYKYNIENNTSITLVTRIFLDLSASIFLDLRMNYYNITETFKFERTGIYAREIDFSKNHKIVAPGVGLGFRFPVGDHMYLRLQQNIDFLKFSDSPAFSTNIIYDRSSSTSNNTEEVNLSSRINKSEIAHSLLFGFGYFF